VLLENSTTEGDGQGIEMSVSTEEISDIVTVANLPVPALPPPCILHDDLELG